ncbi:hypothetical protein ACP70R_048658 [Stipagrostis hirtigluma subsp. patula]
MDTVAAAAADSTPSSMITTDILLWPFLLPSSKNVTEHCGNGDAEQSPIRLLRRRSLGIEVDLATVMYHYSPRIRILWWPTIDGGRPRRRLDRIAKGTFHRISLRVTSPYGNSLHYSENVQSGNFAFTASEAGDYLACFWAPDHRPPVTIGFEFDWRSGVSARDWGAVAKKGQVDMMELELRKLEDTIQSIHEEMFYLRERRNAAVEQEDKLKNGLARFPLTCHLLISGWIAAMASEELF